MFNTLSPMLDGHHFHGRHYVFANENLCILIKISRSVIIIIIGAFYNSTRIVAKCVDDDPVWPKIPMHICVTQPWYIIKFASNANITPHRMCYTNVSHPSIRVQSRNIYRYVYLCIGITHFLNILRYIVSWRVYIPIITSAMTAW